MLMKRLIIVWQMVVLLLAGLASAEAQIPTGPKACSTEDYLAQERGFLLRTVVQAYKEVGKRDQRWNEPAERFLEMCVDTTTGTPDAPDANQLVAAGRAAVEAGCDDPMVAYWLGMFLHKTHKPKDSVSYTRKAYDGFDGSAYSVSYRCWAADRLALLFKQLRKPAEANKYESLSFDLYVRTITSGDYLPGEKRVLYKHIEWMVRNWPVKRVRKLHEAVAGHKGVDPWVLDMIAGRLHIRLAWEARGCELAFKVTEEGWKGFHEHLDKAREALAKAWKLDSKAPESATAMITVATGGGTPPGERPRFWFDRAVSAQFDYAPAYEDLRWSLLPRWGGSHEEIYAFGLECLNTGRFDSSVPYQLFAAASFIVNDLHGDPTYFRRNTVYRDLQKMVTGYLAEPSSKRRHRWFRSLGAAIAWRWGRWKDARRYIDELESEPDADAFGKLGASVDEALGEIYARSGEFAEPYGAADRLAADEEFDQAARAFQDLIDQSKDNSRAAAFLRGKMIAAERTRDFRAGQWVDILPNKDLEGWKVKAGEWRVYGKGFLSGVSRREGLLLVCETSFGRRFEIRGEARFVESPHTEFNIGVCFRLQTGKQGYSFRFYKTEGFAAVYGRHEELSKVKTPVRRVNTFRVQHWDNTLCTYLNETPAQHGVVVDTGGDMSDVVIGIGGDYWYDRASIEFKKLQVRMLDEPPQATVDAAAPANLQVTGPPARSGPPASGRNALIIASKTWIKLGLLAVVIVTILLAIALGVVITRAGRHG